MRLTLIWGAAVMILLSTAMVAEAGGPWSGIQRHNFVEYGVPDTGYVPSAYWVNGGVAMAPSVYARRATPRPGPGGLIETAARRLNPLNAGVVAPSIAFAPSIYRQPAPPRRTVRRFGAQYSGLEAGVGYGYGALYPTGRPAAVGCPVCGRGH